MKKNVLFLFAILSVVGVSRAYDFSAVCSTGQTLYYNIDGENVSLTYPVSGYYWYGQTQPSGVVEIPSTVSYNGTSYTVTTIGMNAFQSCTEMTGVIIPNTVTRIDWAAFNNCTGLTGTLTIPNSVTYIGVSAFAYCSGLTGTLTIHSTVTHIGVSAFGWCSGLNTLNYNATNCYIEDASGIITNWLSGCTSLTTLNIGLDGTEIHIPDYAFYNCTNLRVIELGSGVEDIGLKSFYNCSRIEIIHSNNPTPPIVADTNAFENIWKGVPLMVPVGSVNSYDTAYAWSDFTNIQEYITPTYTVTVAANDATMGYVTGGGSYEENETVTLEAHPYEGYTFLVWRDGITNNPRNITVTSDATYLAIFAASQGIESLDADEITISARNGRITISGANGHNILLVNTLGYTLYCGAGMETMTIEVPITGIYLLQVDGQLVKRIAIVR